MSQTPPLVIESKIRRTGGTTVRLGGETYHFKPRTSDGRHVATVKNPAHQSRLLSISEGYGMAPLDPQAEPAEPQEPAPAEPKKAGATDQKPGSPAAEGQGAATGTEDLMTMPDDEFAALYESEIGDKPRSNAKRETLIARIEAERKEKAGDQS